MKSLNLVVAAVLQTSIAGAQAQSLDYEYFKTSVEPIFLKKRPGHARCYVSHADRSNNAFRLEKLSAGSKFWSEEQAKIQAAGLPLTMAPGAPWTVCITPGP